MLTAVRLGAYVGVLGVVFGAAWGAGALARPALAPATPAPPAATSAVEAPAHPHAGTNPAASEAAVDRAGTDGLATTANGYTLAPATRALTAGRATEFTFVVTGPDGRAVTAFTPCADGSALRLLVVRRDGAGLQVVHPQMAVDGTWRAPLRLPTAGTWRVLAEFTPAGDGPTVLGTDVFAPGEFAPLQFPTARAARLGDYQVRIDGDLHAGTESAIFATVSLGGRAVTDLVPERGAFGDLVALRAGDLAYAAVRAQVHAQPGERAGPGIAFAATVPTEGTYRLFLRFRHAGAIHTVDFTVPTTGVAPVGGPR
ncbi:hypothetical protein ACL02T_05925 [Pseudonocardia sp. RS010]|uniref:hypothetical protein n=1 Tax=Pseudonocardia sp. RS010 TaxID=3385979 RepID=UPI0039A068CC